MGSRQFPRSMSVFSLCRVCKLWKMLVEHSALWRCVPDTLRGTYGLYLGKCLRVSAVNRAWQFLHKTHAGLLGAGIYDGSVSFDIVQGP